MLPHFCNIENADPKNLLSLIPVSTRGVPE